MVAVSAFDCVGSESAVLLVVDMAPGVVGGVEDGGCLCLWGMVAIDEFVDL